MNFLGSTVVDTGPVATKFSFIFLTYGNRFSSVCLCVEFRAAFLDDLPNCSVQVSHIVCSLGFSCMYVLQYLKYCNFCSIF